MAEPNQEPVKKGIKGKAKMVELGVWDLLFAGDIKTALQIAVREVLGPKLKSTISEFSDTVIRSFVYGDDYKSAYDSSSVGRTNYRVISNSNQPLLSSPTTRGGGRYDAMAIEFESYVDAQGMREFIADSIKTYGTCTVIRAFSFADQPTVPNDNNFGWINIDSASITQRGRGKYVLNLPKPIEIDSSKR